MGGISDEFMTPPMMAIGDSLYQGARSLTVARGPMQLSAPALLAEALGIRHHFFCPDPDRPVLLDMERWLRLFPGMSAIRADLKANAEYWLGEPVSASGRPVFDNLAITSTTVGDIFTDTPARALARINEHKARHGDKLKRLNNPVMGGLMMDLNTVFTLNPQRKPGDLMEMTQLDHVIERRPRRLLVNTGSNNGLWDMLFEGKPGGKVELDEEMRTLARRLAALPGDVEHIYVNGLGLPSTVGAVMPIPDMIEWRTRPGKGAYFDAYENRFGVAYAEFGSARMKAMDDHLRAVNDSVRQTFATAFAGQSRLHFVDMAAMLSRYDAKHQKRDETNTVRIGRRTYTNVMTEADIWGAFRTGGLFSLDGLHPTTLGYALMAETVLSEIKAHEASHPGVRDARVDLARAEERDKLLHDMPGIWSMALWLWRDVRKARARRRPDPAPGGDREQMKRLLADCIRGCPHKARARSQA